MSYCGYHKFLIVRIISDLDGIRWNREFPQNATILSIKLGWMTERLRLIHAYPRARSRAVDRHISPGSRNPSRVAALGRNPPGVAPPPRRKGCTSATPSPGKEGQRRHRRRFLRAADSRSASPGKPYTRPHSIQSCRYVGIADGLMETTDILEL